MITQKGLKVEDVFALISEDGTEASFNIAIPECEKFSVTKVYSSAEECIRKIADDTQTFINSHSKTTFTVHSDEDEKEEVVNDSWGAIFNDAKDGVKSRFKC